MPLAGFEPTVSAGEQPQTYALDCTATETSCSKNYCLLNSLKVQGGRGLSAPCVPLKSILPAPQSECVLANIKPYFLQQECTQFKAVRHAACSQKTHTRIFYVPV
jgi:hypothetical protein